MAHSQVPNDIQNGRRRSHSTAVKWATQLLLSRPPRAIATGFCRLSTFVITVGYLKGDETLYIFFTVGAAATAAVIALALRWFETRFGQLSGAAPRFDRT